MSASTPLFEATIEPDEDPFPSGNIGSTGRPRAEPVILTPGPANGNENNAVTSVQGGNASDAEMGIVRRSISTLVRPDSEADHTVALPPSLSMMNAGRDLPEFFPPHGPRSSLLFPFSSARRIRPVWSIHRQLRAQRESDPSLMPMRDLSLWLNMAAVSVQIVIVVVLLSLDFWNVKVGPNSRMIDR